MKYCSKCGNELLDEAVICPKCGCPVEALTNQNSVTTKILKTDKRSRIISATILIIIAFILSLVACGVFGLLGNSHSTTDYPDMPENGTIHYDIFGNIQDIETRGEKMEQYERDVEAWEQEQSEVKHDNQMLLLAICTWSGLSVIGLILGLLSAKKAEQGEKKLTITYMVISVIAPVSALVIRPDFVVAFVCGIGLFMLVPPILNLIAGGKLLQAASNNE